MSYFSKVVRPDEAVVETGRLHWIIYAPGTFLILIAVFISLAPTQGAAIIGVSVFLVGVVSLIANLIEQWTTEIVVTDRRVLLKRGLIARQTFEMNMDRVESVDVNQGILGRIFNYGTIVVRGTGSGTEPLKRIATPLEIRNAISVR